LRQQDALVVFADKTASYTLVLSDLSIDMNSASANNLTIPLNSAAAFPVGYAIIVWQKGAGQTTFVPTGGVTMLSAGSKNKLRVQHSVATLIKVATDTWLLSGDIA
jgi:phosphoserine phosphatase